MKNATRKIADLPPEKLAAFAKKLSGKKDLVRKHELVALPRDGGAFPLSFAQQRLWFLQQLDPQATAYNLVSFLKFNEGPDYPTIHRTLREVVRRHEIFRTTYAMEDGKPVQIVHSDLPVETSIFDLSTLFSDQQMEAETLRLLKMEMTRPFDLNSGPILRSLVLAHEEKFLWGFGYHHIVSDWWSSAIFFREIMHLYHAFRNGTTQSGATSVSLPDLKLQYADYATWQRRRLDDRALEGHIKFWRRKIGREPPVLRLPTDRPRPASPSGRGRKIRAALPAEAMECLGTWRRQQGATLFMALLAVFKVLLYRYTGDRRILVGSAVANRDHPDIQEIIGFFVNTLVFSTDLSGDPSFLELLGRVKKTCLETFSHQDLPFEKLVEAIQPQRAASHNPLFQVIFSLETHFDIPKISARETRDHRVLEEVNTKFDLTVIVHERPSKTYVDFEYSLDLFDAPTIERMLRDFLQLLSGVVEDPEAKISRISLLDAAEHHQLLSEWSDTESRYPRGQSLHGVFSRRAEAAPETVALIEDGSAGRRVSYGELDARTGGLARHLHRAGVRPGDLVGVALERTCDAVVAMLAVLKAGATFVPLDPSYPAERLSAMMEGVAVLLTHRDFAERLPPVDRVIFLDEARQTSDDGHSPPVWLGAPAYVMFTSGSTGRPKGVVVGHQSVLRLVCDANFTSLDASDIVLQLAPLSFDAATFEVWGSLLNGASMVLLPPAAPTLEELGRCLVRHRITTLWLTAGLYHTMVDERLEDFAGVRRLLAGGDVLSPPHVRRTLLAHPDLVLINGYGPTENTTFTACYPMTAADAPAASVPIGRPISDTRIYIVSAAGEAVPVGVPGELLTGGDGLALGYLGRAALSAERFVPDPWSGEPGARLYRTGDLVRFLPDGRVAFLGRSDDQVKIRGFRVEPEEIEAVLCRHPVVNDAVVVTERDQSGDRRLVAYLQPAVDHRLQLEEVRDHLNRILPEYMIPAAFVVLEKFPLNPNGKVDRRALPAPEEDAVLRQDGYRAPRNPTETLLVGLWQKLLGVERVGVDDDFFLLGGHSLLATRLVAQLLREFDREIALRDFFENPTPALLASKLAAAGETSAAAPLVPVGRDRPLPLSFAQQRMWFLDQLEPDGSAYNMPESLMLEGGVDFEALKRAFSVLIERQESLRTRFEAPGGEPRQIVDAQTSFELVRKDFRQLPPERRRAAVRSYLNAEALRPFDLAQGPLIRAVLVDFEDREEAQKHLLFLNLHHIIADGASLRILARELWAIYEAARAGRSASLEPLEIQYADYAHWQRKWLRGEELARLLAYWKGHLDGDLPLLQLPTDHPRPPIQSFEGAILTQELPVGLARGLHELSHGQGGTLFMTLLAGFYALLGRYSGQVDVVLGSPIANRNRAETENLIGFFVNTLVLRADLSLAPDFRALVQQVRELTLGAYDHQDMPFETLVDELETERDLSRNPLFQILFDFHTDLDEEVASTGDGPGDVEIKNAICDLSLSVLEAGERLVLGAQYSTALFRSTTIARMLGHYRNLLEAAVASPSSELHSLPLLSPAEAWQQLGEWSGSLALRKSGRGPRRELQVPQEFEGQAARTPDAIALSGDDAQLSYGELERRAGRLAGKLAALGIGAETRVGLLMARSTEMIAAILAVLKAGGAYVPLDPTDPEERLRFLVDDAAARVLIVDPSTAEHPAAGATPGREILLATGAGTSGVAEASARTIEPEQLAYGIYTSGSTGRPKGVLISHQALASYVRSARESLQLGAGDRVLQFASLGFDVTVEEIFPTLTSGATLVLAEGVQHLDHAAFTELAQRERLTGFEIPTHYWSEWVADLSRRGESLPAALRYVIVGTERVLPERLEGWRAFHRPLVHVYGLTEATVTSLTRRFVDTGRPLPRGYQLPVGRPKSNTSVYLLDRLWSSVPPGVTGEIYVGGASLARGYLGRARLTAERFVPDPFATSPGARLYRTGDLGHFRGDGEVVLEGRIDEQAKIRGYRIEPGEIEASLTRHRAVAEAVVAVREETPGGKRLVAYLVLDPGAAAPTVTEWRRFLGRRLPEYMIPTAFVTLEALPLSANGKIDLRALPQPESGRPRLEATYVAPRGELERKIARIWCQVLKVDQAGIHDNFFELGGNSLLIVQVHRRLVDEMGLSVSLVDLFTAPTVHALAQAVSQQTEQTGGEGTAPDSAYRGQTEVAVVGMVGRFSGTHDLDEFWQHIKDRIDDVRSFSEEELLAGGNDPELLRQPNFIASKGVLPGADLFDAAFFQLPPREAEVMDPQHRIFIEAAWQALENAGYDPAQYSGRVGVYAGCSPDYYYREYLHGSPLMESVDPLKVEFGNHSDFLPLRVSYLLDLDGPSVNVQSACSTSLTAIAEAYFSLLGGQCDMALAGGVSVLVPQVSGYLYNDSNIWSEDGRCRSFDAGATGLVMGEGLGIVVLKRLADALADGDQIHAVIKGGSIQNEGAAKVGFAAPGVEGQIKMLRSAIDMSGVDPRTIGLVEAHGSATRLGDPAEAAALTRAYRAYTSDKGFCALGSVKSNIGHADIAAGVAGFLKTALALREKIIPPSLHFEKPNPEIDLENSPFYVPTHVKLWERENGVPRRAAVSSLGVGGTNTHLILEEAPVVLPSGPGRSHHLLPLSAKTTSALGRMAGRLADHLEAHPRLDLADVAFTLQVGRRALSHRRFVVCRDRASAVAALRGKDARQAFEGRIESPKASPAVAFMFSGPGAQYPGMGEELYRQEQPFRERVDACSEFLRAPLGLDLREILYPPPERKEWAREQLEDRQLAPPAIFVTSYAMAGLWQAWGIEPRMMIGHGLGEYTAACVAGAMSAEEALRLILGRDRLVRSLPESVLVAVSLPREEVAEMSGDGIFVAAVNGPFSCVVSGAPEEVAALEAKLDEREADHRRLRISNALPSRSLEPIREAFREEVRGIDFKKPQIPFISNLTGFWIKPKQATDPEYWVDHLTGTVRFAEGIAEVLARDRLCLLEVGPGRALTTLARQQLDRKRSPILLTSIRQPREEQPDSAFLMTTLGRLWLAGAPVDGARLYRGQRRLRVALPTYPFERQRFWVDPPERSQIVAETPAGKILRKDPAIEKWFYTPTWQRAPHLGRAKSENVREIAPCWLIFGDKQGISRGVTTALEALGGEVVSVQAGAGFAELSYRRYAIRPDRRSDYEILFEELSEQGVVPSRIVHLWGVTPLDLETPQLQRFEAGLERGIFSLLLLVQALRQLKTLDDPRITVITNNMQDVTGSEALLAEKATVLGVCRVLSQEHPHLACHSVDLMLPEAGSPREERLVEQLVAECLQPTRELAVAYRGGYRWIQDYEPVELGDSLDARTRFKEGGVYLITGGQGYLGFELGALLARKYRARLALIGRTELPPRSEWDRWIADHQEGEDKVSFKIRALRQLEELGAEVLLLTADAADREQMEMALAETVERFGGIDGVLHAAGITDESHYHPIRESAPENCRYHFAPKIEGLLVLEELLRDRPVDFCLVFSSIASILGGLGFVNYTAANAVLDNHVQRLNRSSETHWVAVNWDGWLTTEELIEAAREAEEGSLLELAMTMEEGLTVTERILARPDLGQVAVSTGDLGLRIDRWVRLASIEHENQGSGERKASDVAHHRPALSNDYEAPRNELEQQIAEIWQELLGVDEVGVHDNFFELGGDSLLAVHLSSKMLKGLGVEVSGGSLLAAQTVAEQTVIIVQKMAEEAGEADVAAILAEES